MLLGGATLTRADVSAAQGVGADVEGATLTDSVVSAPLAAVVVGGTVRRTTLNSGPGPGLMSCCLSGLLVFGATTPSVVSDSVITSTSVSGRAVRVQPSQTAGRPSIVMLRNVTAIAGGAHSIGLLAETADNSPGGPGTIDARNVIARGTERTYRPTLALRTRVPTPR